MKHGKGFDTVRAMWTHTHTHKIIKHDSKR